MLDLKDCSFASSGGIMRISKGNKNMLQEMKTRGLYRLEGIVQTREATVRHGSSGISKDKGSNSCTKVHEASARVPGISVVVQEYKEML
ncbi:hypothetical protein Acr_05g0010100 [Actinidia rufa]|uniref:Uncharacterized protein n=1 Tax=Actinidia rufa TaxID=165716 RepID=A0A7J0ELN3_9ERIC|nr:hypothetical protein Acr_05g0010100 [Actinidia rufa]